MFLHLLSGAAGRIYIYPDALISVATITVTYSQTAHGLGNFDHINSGACL